MNITETSFSKDDESDHSVFRERPDSQNRGTEDEQCTKDADLYLAGIPWLPKEIGAPLAETKHMQNILNVFPENDPRRKRRKDLYEAIVEIFPEFLPARYHSMDGLALHENSKDGKYWANSTAFLLNSHAFGCNVLIDLQRNLGLQKELTHKSRDINIYKRSKKYLYMGNQPEECKSAAEFLLEPWVLLQLPFQPLLMLQWSTGALAEALKFQRELVDLCMFYPKKMKNVVDQLFRMYFKLLEYVLSFQAIATKKGFRAKIMGKWNSELAGKLAKCIEILEFVLSDKCKNVMNALKRMAWSKSTSTKKLLEYVYKFDYNSLPFYYNYHGYWRKNARFTGLYGSPENVCMMSQQQQAQIYQNRIKISESVDLPAATLVDVNNFINEKLVRTRKIQIKCNDAKILVKNVKDKAAYLNYYNIYQTYSETCSKLKGAGIIYDITALHSDVVLAEVEAEMVKLISNSAEVIINPVNCEGPELSLNQVESLLSKVFSKTSCSFYKVLERVRVSFNSEHAEFPDYDQGAEKIAAHLQERIKRLVFSMIQRQLKSLQETSLNFYPECQFVQMILPCFVASILDMDKDESVSEDKKRKFIDYVHELIKSYENYEFCQKLTLQAKFPFNIHVCYTIESIIGIFFEDLEIAFKILFGDCRVINAISKMGCSSINLCKIMLTDKFSASLFLDWIFQMLMLANRMRDALSRFFGVLNICGDYFEVCFIINCVGKWVDLDPKDQLVFEFYRDRYSSDDFLASKSPRTDQEEYNLAMDKLRESAKEISEANLSGVVLFFAVKDLNTQRFNKRVFNGQGPGFALDPVDSAFWHLYCGDLIKLKQCLRKTRQGDVDLYLVPIQVARSNACYESVLRHLTSDGKVPMKKPGETTFFPVQHCRWCGLVEQDAFLVCPMCAETPEYPDLNFFCSSQCQNEALEKQHQEEHVAYLMVKCGIS